MCPNRKNDRQCVKGIDEKISGGNGAGEESFQAAKTGREEWTGTGTGQSKRKRKAGKEETTRETDHQTVDGTGGTVN